MNLLRGLAPSVINAAPRVWLAGPWRRLLAGRVLASVYPSPGPPFKRLPWRNVGALCVCASGGSSNAPGLPPPCRALDRTQPP